MVEKTDKLTQARARDRKTDKTDGWLKQVRKTEGSEDRQKPKIDKNEQNRRTDKTARAIEQNGQT